MPTNTLGSTARTEYSQQIVYISRDFAYNSAFVVSGSSFVVGTVPAGATILRGGVVVSTAFTSSTKTLDIGTAADPDGFATALALGTIGVIPADEMATTDDAGPYTTDTVIVAVPTLSGGTSTAGVGRVWLEYILGNDFR